jgi:hypothetical protein
MRITRRFVDPARLLAFTLVAGALVFSLAVGATMVAAQTAGDAGAGKQRAQAKQPAPSKAAPARKAPTPPHCAGMVGVEQKICVECGGVPYFKRIGCQQRVFWTSCKGKRLFEDSYCQMNQDQGPPRGEGN